MNCQGLSRSNVDYTMNVEENTSCLVMCHGGEFGCVPGNRQMSPVARVPTGLSQVS